MLQIDCIPALVDNQVYFLKDKKTGKTAVIDPSESAPVTKHINKTGGRLDYIINTHHHYDHVGGNLDLKQTYGAKVLANPRDKLRIPGFDLPLEDSFNLGNSLAKIMLVPGHTKHHIALNFECEDNSHLFCGDTLFVGGCGGIFEGTPEELFESLQKFAGLPHKTLVYCGHDYCYSNLAFALSVEPNNNDIKAALQLISGGVSITPSTIGRELLTNPFLRSRELRQLLGLDGLSNFEVFKKVRMLRSSSFL